MTITVTVRDVPEDVRDTLAQYARQQGQSLQAFLLAVLTRQSRYARITSRSSPRWKTNSQRAPTPGRMLQPPPTCWPPLAPRAWIRPRRTRPKRAVPDDPQGGAPAGPAVESARGAVPGLLPTRFPEPLAEPALPNGWTMFARSQATNDVSGGDLDRHPTACCRWHGLAGKTQALDVKSDGLTHLGLALLGSVAGGCDSGKIWSVRTVVGRAVTLDHDQIAAHGSSSLGASSAAEAPLRNPACLRMLSRVLGCRSSLGFPETVTTPRLVGCVN